MYIGDHKCIVQAKTAEQATEAARKVNEELKKQMDIRSLELSSDEYREEGEDKVLCTSRWIMEAMKKLRPKSGLGLSVSAVHSGGDDVSVIEWRKWNTELMEAMENL